MKCKLTPPVAICSYIWGFLNYGCIKSIISNTKGYKLSGLKVNFETNLFSFDVAIIDRVHDVEAIFHLPFLIPHLKYECPLRRCPSSNIPYSRGSSNKF